MIQPLIIYNSFALILSAGFLFLLYRHQNEQIVERSILLALSAVPRSWASVRTEIHPDQFSLVSREIGMERGHAPSLRFFCHPEVIIIELLSHEHE